MAPTWRLSYYFVGMLVVLSAWRPHQDNRHFHIRAQSSSGSSQAPNFMESQEERQEQIEQMSDWMMRSWLVGNEQQDTTAQAMQQQQLDGLVRTVPSSLEYKLREWKLDDLRMDDGSELQIARRRNVSPFGRRFARPASFAPEPTSTTMRMPTLGLAQDALAAVEMSLQKGLTRGGPGRGAHQTSDSSSAPTTGERKRRMSSVQTNMLRNLLTPADQLSAIQSLGISLDGDAFARVYKPKIMSTARGFGK